MSQPLFGLVPAGQSVVTQPTEAPTPTSLIYALPTAAPARPFSHVVVFLLPGAALPAGTAAAIYLVTPPDPAAGPAAVPASRFLGGVGPGKESAIFKLGGGGGGGAAAAAVILGVSIEDAVSVAARVAALAAAAPQPQPQPLPQPLPPSPPPPPAQALALVPAAAPAAVAAAATAASGQQQQKQQPSTLVLAQRIIKNAFNFLSSFAGQAGAVEVVPMKAFEDWWRKFESRVRTDPGFLERDD